MTPYFLILQSAITLSSSCTLYPNTPDVLQGIYMFSINIRFSSSYKFRYSIAGKLYQSEFVFHNHDVSRPRQIMFSGSIMSISDFIRRIICQYLLVISRILPAIAQITIAETNLGCIFLVNFIFTKQFKVSDNIFIRL